MATPRKFVREYVSSRYSSESRKLPHLFYISDNILPFRSLGDTEAHGVIGNHNIGTAQPLIQSSLIPGQTQLRQSRGMSKSGYTSRFSTKHSSQPRSLPVCLQRMATRTALLKDSPATHRIAGPCGSNLASSRVLAQHAKSLDVARRKLRLPMHRLVLRRGVALRFPNDLGFQDLPLFCGDIIPARQVHRLPRPNDVPFDKPRSRSKPFIRRPPCLIRVPIGKLRQEDIDDAAALLLVLSLGKLDHPA